MEAFKEVKEVYDGAVDTEPPKKQLRRHPTDEASDNNDVDDNSRQQGDCTEYRRRPKPTMDLVT